MLRSSLLALGAACLVLGACSAPPKRPAPSATRETPGASDLKRRATALWQARVNRNWETAYTYVHPDIRARTTKDEFVAFCESEEPLVIKDARIGDVQVRDERGWAEVTYDSTMRKFPGVPARTTTTWDKWFIVDGAWYPVPDRMREDFPEAPARRDAAAEDALRARFLASWQARQTRDWNALYDLCDPPDRQHIPKEDLVESEELSEYLSYDVHWIEVVNQRGRVRVTYTVKTTDPNMTKLPPRDQTVTEGWILRDGTWYRDPVPAAS